MAVEAATVLSALKVYPSLDHLLFAGSGPSTRAEYTVPAPVAPELVADLAAWVAGR